MSNNNNNKKTNNNVNGSNYTTKNKGIIITLSRLGIVLIATFIGIKMSGKLGELSNDSVSKSTNQDLVIPISEISETVKFYPVNVEGTNLEVLSVKAPDGTIRTAFNTCQICYDSGRGYYKQEGNLLICQNCGNQYPMDRVEIESGGCNPWPIFEKNKTVTNDSITISYDFLKESKAIFANWKRSY